MASRDGRAYEPHLSQLTLSVAAIHTTSDLLTQMVLDLAEHAGQGPEGEEENEEGREGVKEGRRGLLAALRAEIVEVLGREGWKKTSLYGLKLLDSCIRETQRLKPIGAGEFVLFLSLYRSLSPEPLFLFSFFHFISFLPTVSRGSNPLLSPLPKRELS